jgi:4-diphosphocytidyl-2-C-methyl-D-erythritol kinase
VSLRPAAAASRAAVARGRAAVRLRAPAKINLGLRVLGALKDGSHSVATIYQAVDLFDDVELALGEQGVRLSLHGQRRDGVPTGPDNLAARAAEALLARLGSSSGVEIRLTKRIPHGAGLGGGSSDAAAVLRGLALLLDEDIPREELTAIAAELGADVPFFLEGGTAFGYHRGDHLLSLPAPPPLPVLVVVPDVQVSTFWAYSAWDLGRASNAAAPARAVASTSLSTDELARLENDFEPAVFERFPDVAAVHRALAEGNPVVARLSGTGAACFALYTHAKKRDAEAERLARAYRHHPDYGIFRVRFFAGGVEVVA